MGAAGGEMTGSGFDVTGESDISALFLMGCGFGSAFDPAFISTLCASSTTALTFFFFFFFLGFSSTLSLAAIDLNCN
jgi:hypothetical protein